MAVDALWLSGKQHRIPGDTAADRADRRGNCGRGDLHGADPWLLAWLAFFAGGSPGLVKINAPIVLIALITILYQKISVAMVSTLDGPTVTGWFSAALRVVEASKTVHLAVFTAVYPAMAQVAYSAGKTSLIDGRPWHGSFGRPWKLLLIGSGLASAAMFFLAAPLTGFLYGSDFAQAVPALKLLAWILIPFTVNTFSRFTI